MSETPRTWYRDVGKWRFLAQRRDVWLHFGFNVRVPLRKSLTFGVLLNLGPFCLEASRR